MQSEEESEPVLRISERLRADCVRLAEDPALKEVFSHLRGLLRVKSERSQPDEKELREHCYYQLNAIVRLEGYLQSMAKADTIRAVNRERSRVSA